ncbi:hypothetical protein Avbf_06053 [Armadillidium vulgare]|nr:hypothetical protein Avbf_06053 [Armadillidium vulgare]
MRYDEEVRRDDEKEKRRLVVIDVVTHGCDVTESLTRLHLLALLLLSYFVYGTGITDFQIDNGVGIVVGGYRVNCLLFWVKDISPLN